MWHEQFLELDQLNGAPNVRVMWRGENVVDRLRWLPQAGRDGAYQVRGTREYVSREALQAADLELRAAAWRFMKRQTLRMQRDEIKIPEWRQKILSALLRYAIGSVGLFNGWWDKEYSAADEANIHTIAYITAYQVANRITVSELCETVLRGDYDTFNTWGVELLRLRVADILNGCVIEPSPHIERVMQIKDEILAHLAEKNPAVRAALEMEAENNLAPY